MKKSIGIITSSSLLIISFFIQTGTVSCTKETTVRDTIIELDTVIVRDTIFSEMEQIKRGINDGLWAHYPINGSAFDSSGNNHSISLNGNSTLSNDRWGIPESSISFEAANSYALIPDGKTFNSQNFTVAFFIYVKNTAGLFFGKQDYQTANGATFNVGFDDVIDGSLLRFAVTSNQTGLCSASANGSTKITQDGTVFINEWYHVAIVNEGSSMKLYINGQFIESKNHAHTSLNFCNNAGFVLGSWWQNDPKYFSGKMDNLRIYTRVLNSKEINYLMKCD